MIPLVTTLQEPPVVGRFYMVPVVRYYWLGRVDDWPVNGPMHHDKSINFTELHYHADPRFFTQKQRDFHNDSCFFYDAPLYNATPISEPEVLRNRYGPLPRRASLKKRKCTSTVYAWEVAAEKTAHWPFEQQYGNPAPAIHRPDGRILCPHRKADLSSLPVDADGTLICPLHGLRVQCRKKVTA